MIKNLQEYFQGILDNLTGGMISVDTDEKVVYINPMAGKILHIEEPQKLLGMKYDRAFEHFPALKEVIKEALQTGKLVRRAEIEIMHASVPLIIGYSTLQVKNPNGESMGLAVTFQDITFVSASKSKK
ncbi:MAG: PAS domain-containing protein [Elusimicrobia bacterium]|nr:PAS domain-containing protein [Elusimicrobiota bacterium]